MVRQTQESVPKCLASYMIRSTQILNNRPPLRQTNKQLPQWHSIQQTRRRTPALLQISHLLRLALLDINQLTGNPMRGLGSLRAVWKNDTSESKRGRLRGEEISTCVTTVPGLGLILRSRKSCTDRPSLHHSLAYHFLQYHNNTRIQQPGRSERWSAIDGRTGREET